MPSDQSDTRISLTMKINGAVGKRLQELAAIEDASASKLAREILEEIVPKIDTVQRRVVIKLKGAQQ